MNKKGNNLRLCSIIFPAVLMIVVFSLTSCKKTVSEKAIVLFTLGKSEIITNGTARPAKIKDVITDNDILQTGDDGQMSVQLGSRIIFKITRNTSIKAVSLTNTEKNELLLESGTVLSSIKKLKKGQSYSVTTSTSLAAVRGTTFLVTHNNNRATVAVSEGYVHVKNLTNNEEKQIDKGKKALVTDILEVVPMSKLDSLLLEKISIMSIVEDPDKKTEDQLIEIEKQYNPREKELDEQIDRLMPMTLQQIKAKYGRIDTVQLFSGKVYRGVILTRGATFTFRTPGGVIFIPKSKIKNTSAQ